MDFRLENWNNETKELLKHLGINLNEKTTKCEASSIAFLEELLSTIDRDIQLHRLGGKHSMKKKDADTKSLVKDLIGHKVFDFTPDRSYEKFSNFDQNILSKMDITKLAFWIRDQSKELMKEFQ